MCPICGALTDATGRCYTKGCDNARSGPRALKRPTGRQGLRKKSARKLEEERMTKNIRSVAPGEACELCGKSGGVSTHEVTGGSHRHRAVYDRRCQLRVCLDCHQKVQSIPYVNQILHKIVAMVEGINACHGSRVVEMEDVWHKILDCYQDESEFRDFYRYRETRE